VSAGGLVEVASFPDRMTAEMALGLLRSAGIEAVLFDGGVAGLGLGGLAPARLMVPPVDQDEAERLLAS
jgi:hypothetical protein